MRAGELDRRITLQRKASTRNASGDEIETWSNVAGFVNVAARRMDGSRAREQFGAAQTFATLETVFKVRYAPFYAEIDVATHRLVFGTQTYNIVGSVELGRQDGVLLGCVARGEKP